MIHKSYRKGHLANKITGPEIVNISTQTSGTPKNLHKPQNGCYNRRMWVYS